MNIVFGHLHGFLEDYPYLLLPENEIPLCYLAQGLCWDGAPYLILNDKRAAMFTKPALSTVLKSYYFLAGFIWAFNMRSDFYGLNGQNIFD
jgi:hypothetical protein